MTAGDGGGQAEGERAQIWPWHAGLRRPPRPDGLTIISWNVAGLRALLRRRPAALAQLAEAAGADIICLQETRLQQQHVAEVMGRLQLPGWQGHFCCSAARPGYAGVATLWRAGAPLHQTQLRGAGTRGQGRLVTSHFGQLRLVNAYVPNSGEGLKNIAWRCGRWDPLLGRYLAGLGPAVLLAGDLNVAPGAIDVYDPVGLTRRAVAGFTAHERDNFARHLTGRGLCDLFRRQHPRVRAYTFFSYRGRMRAKQRGWRLDHFLAAPAVAEAAYDCWVAEQVEGSDHLPIGLTLAPTAQLDWKGAMAAPARAGAAAGAALAGPRRSSTRAGRGPAG